MRAVCREPLLPTKPPAEDRRSTLLFFPSVLYLIARLIKGNNGTWYDGSSEEARPIKTF